MSSNIRLKIIEDEKEPKKRDTPVYEVDIPSIIIGTQISPYTSLLSQNKDLFLFRKVEDDIQTEIDINFEITDEEIEDIIITYLKESKEEIIYPSDIADLFNFDSLRVFKISEKLINDGKIKRG